MTTNNGAPKKHKLPLEGIRVIDFTVVIGGPSGTLKLADLGAEVIRIESTQELGVGSRTAKAKLTKKEVDANPIQQRNYPDSDPGVRHWNRSASFNSHGRNKLCITVDTKKPEGKDIIRRLTTVSDVVIENHATDYMENRGLTYDWFKAIRPDIIMVRMPGFGLDGPNAYWRTFGSTAESHAGRSLLSGYRDMDGTHIPWVMPADAAAGASAAFAVIAALHYRRRTGKGQLIDAAMTENILTFMGVPFLDFTLDDKIAENLGNRHPYAAPHGCYRARGKDRWINITVETEAEWQGFCTALGNPEWTKDPKFSDPVNRHKNQDDLDRHVEAWTQERDDYEMFHLLQQHGVPAGPVLHAADIHKDPHVASREYFEEVYHPDVGVRRQPGVFWKYSETPLHIRRHAPRLGEDNEYVYKKLLGYSDTEYRDLEAKGHIGMEYAPHVP